MSKRLENVNKQKVKEQEKLFKLKEEEATLYSEI